MVGITRIWVTDDFFHITIPIGDKKKAFNGEEDFRIPPKILSGEEILEKVDLIPISWEKMKIKSLESNVNTNCWKKTKSIFLELEYWKYLHVH